MPVTVDATVGGPSSNSYVDVATATAYFASRIGSGAWAASSSDTQAQALITATARLEEERWQGRRTSGTQALDWPRSWVINEKKDQGWFSRAAYPLYFAQDAIPDIVKNACCELALALINTPGLFQQSGQGQFKSLKAGPVEAVFVQPVRVGALPVEVMRLLASVILTGSGYARLSRC